MESNIYLGINVNMVNFEEFIFNYKHVDTLEEMIKVLK